MGGNPRFDDDLSGGVNKSNPAVPLESEEFGFRSLLLRPELPNGRYQTRLRPQRKE